MAETSAAPAVPAAPTVLPDPALAQQLEELARQRDAYHNQNAQLLSDLRALNGDFERAKSEAASARGEKKPLRDEIARLKEIVQKSDNLKELARLRTELAECHKKISEKDKALEEQKKYVNYTIGELSTRAQRAESKFQALEGTASIMAKGRDKANEAAAAMLAERDRALKDVQDLKLDVDQWRSNCVKTQGELEKAQVELKALRQGKPK